MTRQHHIQIRPWIMDNNEGQIQPVHAYLRVYEHKNYAGSSTVFTKTVDIKQPWNTTISSLRFPWKGWSVVAFDPDGRQVAYNGDTSYVGDEMNDRISSLVVLPFRINELCYTVYEHKDYGGRHQRFCGDQDLSSSSWNNIISSLRVETEGCELTLYDRSYHGKFKTFSGNVPYVDREWNDKATSIQIRPWKNDNREGQIQAITYFYEHPDFRGASIAVRGASKWIGDRMNGKISSVKCDGACAVLVFEHRNYEGEIRETRLYDGSQRSLTNFYNKMSSALVFMEAIYVTFYEHAHYGSQSRRDCGDVDSFSSGWHDRVSSLMVECGHCSVIMYEYSNFKGRLQSFHGRCSVCWKSLE